MRPANLLIQLESFEWNDSELDRSQGIEEFMLAHNKARQSGDSVFNAPNFWLINILGANFIETIANSRTASTIFPWLQPNQRQFIVRQIMNYPTTSGMASNLQELEAEDGHINENNGLLCIGGREGMKMVFDIDSWYALHVNYIRQFPEFINWESNQVLPFSAYSNRFILEVVNQYSEQEMGKSEMLTYFQNTLIRTIRANAGTLIEIANEIAIRNGYNHNASLSSEETQLRGSRRAVFEISKNGHPQYLSLDFENGQFEVCDENGYHFGVCNFSGIQTAEADQSGGHNIWVLSRR